MATYYIGADVHSNNTELAIEQRGKIVARYSVPTASHIAKHTRKATYLCEEHTFSFCFGICSRLEYSRNTTKILGNLS